MPYQTVQVAALPKQEQLISTLKVMDVIVGRIIGKNGYNIKEIQGKVGNNCQIWYDKGEKRFKITANSEQNKTYAINLLEESHEKCKIIHFEKKVNRRKQWLHTDQPLRQQREEQLKIIDRNNQQRRNKGTRQLRQQHVQTTRGVARTVVKYSTR
jgi:predicted RNA-binding protein YlqC (UPF0109 family)